MHWTEKYLCPQVKKDKFNWKRIKFVIEDFKEIMLHALSFHQQPQEPQEQLPEFKTKDIELVYSVCKEFYNNANDRIDKLEDKAIKLLSYISALFAFISFLFVNTQFIFTKIMLIISLIALVLALLISFRCVNIKGRKSLFIPSVYNFDEDIPKENFEKKIIAKRLLNSAIYNENIADNTADILKASRYALALAIAIGVIGFLGGSFSYFKSPSKTTTVKIENQVKLSDIGNKLDSINKAINEVNNNIKVINDNKKLKDQIDMLTNELKLYKSNYDNLSKRLEEVKQRKK